MAVRQIKYDANQTENSVLLASRQTQASTTTDDAVIVLKITMDHVTFRQ
jgi:hypothetical protein